jgi:hypothetical protein
MRAINGLKVCATCGVEKPIEEFGKNSKSVDGLRYSCKECRRSEYIESAEIKKAQSKERYYSKRAEIGVKNKQYKNDHAEWYREYAKKYYQANKDKIKERVKNNHYAKMETDLEYKIRQRCRTRLYNAVKGHVKSARTRELIGCDVEFLMKRLEAQFTEGMTWDNYGEWHIDHIRPCASFDLTKEVEQRECFNYKNLQPLWAEQNHRKHSKYEARR